MAVVLVTGANGFLGTAIVRECMSAGWTVRALGRQPSPQSSDGHYFRGDVQDPSSLKTAMFGVDAVIHAAALVHQFGAAGEDAAAFEAINTQGTANVARAAVTAGAKQLLLISSVAVYGPATVTRDEQATCQPDSPYAVSKLAAEKVARSLTEKTTTRLLILRPATVYGAGDRGNVCKLIRQIDRRRFLWIGDGSNHKSLVHRNDVARACLAVLQQPALSQAIFNVAAPPATMREIVDLIAAQLPQPVPRWQLPGGMVSAMTSWTAGLSGRRGLPARIDNTIKKWLADDTFDSSRLMSATSWRPQVTLAEGLAEEVEWYRTERDRLEKTSPPPSTPPAGTEAAP